MAQHCSLKEALLALLAAALCVISTYADEPKCQDIPPWGQCGGTAGSCSDRPEYMCVNGPYPGCNCVDGYKCTSKDEWFWQCTPNKPCTIPIHGQCGGKGGNCWDWKQCHDEPYEGCSCESGSTCQKLDEYYYECKPPVTLTPPHTNTTSLQNSKCTIPKWASCTPHHHLGLPPPEVSKHVEKDGHDDVSQHCKCTWGTECKKQDHEHVWKCVPTHKPSPPPPRPSPPPPPKVCLTTCKVVLSGEHVTGICSKARTGSLAAYRSYCPEGYTNSGEECDDHNDCGVCCVKTLPTPPPKSPPPPPKVCPTTCQVKVLYGHLVKGICSGSGGAHTSGKSAPCPAGYVSSGEKCDGHKGCGECCVKDPVAKPIPSPPPPSKACPTKCEVKVLYGQVMNGTCSGPGAGHAGGKSAPCPAGYISSGEKCSTHTNCGDCCVKTDPSPSPPPPRPPPPPPKACPATCHSKKFEGYGSGVCSSSLASNYRTYCPPGYINSGEKCDYNHKDCGVCCIPKSGPNPGGPPPPPKP